MLTNTNFVFMCDCDAGHGSNHVPYWGNWQRVSFKLRKSVAVNIAIRVDVN